MLDCGLTLQSVLRFLPLSYVPLSRLQNLPTWMPNETFDVDLEGVSLPILSLWQNYKSTTMKIYGFPFARLPVELLRLLFYSSYSFLRCHRHLFRLP